MSEKRFTVDDDGIYDNQEKKHFKFIAYDWMECDIYECCEKLNEQQSTVSRLEKEKRYWKSKAMTLLMQVRRLTPRMTAKEVIEFAKELEDE